MQMDHILERLIAADRNAQAAVEEAEEYLETTIGNMDRDVENHKELYAQRAEHRIGLIRDEEGKASLDATRDITSRYGQLMENLDKTYEENHQRWEEELFHKCIGN